MSISKNNEIYYTEEEMEKARQNCNALKYALSRGYHLVKSGNEYRLKEHDSMVFQSNGKWHWNSQGLHGDALDFIQAYENKSFKEAVCILAGTQDRPLPIGPIMETPIPTAEKKNFTLPDRADNYKILFAYLINERGIDQSLVKHLVIEKKLYQSKAYNNVVMVGFDDDMTARYASLRSTNSYKKIFKIDVPGSDKSYPFIINGKTGNNTVCVFESPIEAMSYWSLCKETESERIHCHMISLGGAGVQLALDRFLSEHPNIENIVVGLNNDSQKFGHSINAGRNGAQRIIEKYGEKYHVTMHQPHLNDWNDVLKNYRHGLESKMHELNQKDITVTQVVRPRKSLDRAI